MQTLPNDFWPANEASDKEPFAGGARCAPGEAGSVKALMRSKPTHSHQKQDLSPKWWMEL